MRTVCIVQARMESRRLPGKMLYALNGRTVVEEVLTRCRSISGVDEVVCAIPDTKSDNELDKVASKLCDVFRGDPEDVLLRYRMAAEWKRADIIMRVTGDCPLISPGLCEFVLECYDECEAEYTSNVYPQRTYPQGYDCEVFGMDALLEADDVATEPSDREHVTPWMQRNLDYSVVMAPYQMDGRLTLDTDDDYRVICAAFGHNPHERLRPRGPGGNPLPAAGRA
jgi:spore coat polysaccharide biosynthesis protein SpsF (cytidylyltransferase family)